MSRSPKLPTVNIVHGKGFLTINERDYDPSKHTVYDQEIPVEVRASLVNLNSADLAELRKLPKIRIKDAQAIMKLRPITSLDQLNEVCINVDAIADLICL